MKERKIKFWLAILAYLAVTVLDLVFTYIATPTLLLEGNPLALNDYCGEYMSQYSWAEMSLGARF